MTCSRERIISAGFELFETTPFKEVTVEDILKIHKQRYLLQIFPR